jgi:hypothetical protein
MCIWYASSSLERDRANGLGQMSKWNVVTASSLIPRVYATSLLGRCNLMFFLCTS